MKRKFGALTDEIHNIRFEIYDKTKNMSDKEFSDIYRIIKD
jgi:hypothetical protein